MPLAPIEAIQSDRLSLRPVEEQDLPDLLEVNGDPEVTKFLPYATWETRADGVAWLERMRALSSAGTGRQLVVVRKHDDKCIGTVLLFRYDEGSSRLEIGYVVGRAHWRQGYAREALAAALTHAFLELGIRRIEAEVDPANAASNALLLALGFRHEGILRQRWVAKGLARDVNAYGLLAAEWEAAGRRGVTLRYSTTDLPPEAAAMVVDAGLDQYNHAVAPLGAVRPLAAFATSSEERIVGGAVGRTWGRCCELLQLWVEPASRHRGIGSELLQRFEAHGRSRGCDVFYLTTLSFQAPDFYVKAGYRPLAEITGYPEGIAKYLMHKTEG